MKFDGPIDVRPLTMRGTFGIAWKLVRRGFGSILGYAILMQLLLLLGTLVVVSPILGSVIKGDFESVDFGVGLLVALLLLLVYTLAYILVYVPMFSGTLYGEYSARVYANGAAAGTLLKRGKFSLRRYFTTAMALVACGIIVGIAQSIVQGIASGVLGFVGLFAMMPSMINSAMLNSPEAMLSGLSAGMIVFVLLLSLLSAGVTLAAQSILCFTYPVAANESAFHFNAVGRSIKLAFSRFGRVIGCKLLLGAIFTGIELVLVALVLLVLALMGALTSDTLTTEGIAALSLYAVIQMALAVFATLYTPALDTVLYYDARVRLEGRGWLGMDKKPDEAGANPVLQENSEENTNQNRDSGGEYGA